MLFCGTISWLVWLKQPRGSNAANTVYTSTPADRQARRVGQRPQYIPACLECRKNSPGTTNDVSRRVATPEGFTYYHLTPPAEWLASALCGILERLRR